MKILWVKTDYLHPTNRGGQIRTLEMLKRLHIHHEVDYVTLADASNHEGPQRAKEYCRRHFAVQHEAAKKHSVRFGLELVRGLTDPLPVSVFRWKNEAMLKLVEKLEREEKYDSVVCDFLAPAASMPDWGRMILFQHNVEALIWERHAQQGPTALHRWYFEGQARKMREFEGRVCRQVRGVIAVSKQDAEMMEVRYGAKNVKAIQTGVDLDYFEPRVGQGSKAELVFVGSMDWLPNTDGVEWLKTSILPKIWAKRPETTVALVGRTPSPAVRALAAAEPRITVTGTVDDVRPWLWGAKVSMVPLRIGGGTRLKIFEAMAAGIPVVSTAIGAEGLEVKHGETIRLADAEEDFAAACLELLGNESLRQQMAGTALRLVRERFGWEAVAEEFSNMLFG